MDNKQIEEAVAWLTPFDTDVNLTSDHIRSINILLSLAQLFLSVKGVPHKAEIPETRIATPLCEISFNKGRIQGRNQAIDEFTAWLAGLNIRNIIEKYSIEHEKIHESTECGMCQEGKNNLAQAIKTMILEEK